MKPLWQLTFVLTMTVWFLTSNTVAQPVARSGFSLAWSDEFDSATVDASKWNVADTNQTTNNSQQDYLPSQVTTNSGDLVITSQNIASRGLPYRSGLVTSTAIQKYGRWDVQAKLPATTGMWPAIWLLSDTDVAPWPSQGEIDIMENRGNEPNMTSSALHYGTNPPFSHSFATADQRAVHDSSLQNYHADYHKYSVEWDPTQVRYYVDDVHHWTVRDSDVGGFLTNNIGPMRLIINTAVGGDFLDNPDGSTVWPQEFRVDSVHAYERTGEATLTFENGGFEDNGGSMADWTTFGNEGFNVSSGNEHIGTGAEALKLYGQFNGGENFSGVEQGISVTSGDELFASADAFIATLDSIAGTDNEAILKIDYYSQNYGLFGSTGYLGTDSITLANGTSLNEQWLNTELLSVAPDGAVEARIAVVFRQPGNAGGAVYVDNINFSITSVPEPASGALILFVATALVSGRRRVSSITTG